MNTKLLAFRGLYTSYRDWYFTVHSPRLKKTLLVIDVWPDLLRDKTSYYIRLGQRTVRRNYV